MGTYNSKYTPCKRFILLAAHSTQKTLSKMRIVQKIYKANCNKQIFQSKFHKANYIKQIFLQICLQGANSKYIFKQVGQRQSQNPISSAFWVQKDFGLKNCWVPNNSSSKKNSGQKKC